MLTYMPIYFQRALGYPMRHIEILTSSFSQILVGR
jgi:hypothetical protein